MATAQAPPPSPQRTNPVLPSGHTRSIAVTAFSPDSRLLATGADDMTIRIWDPLSGRSLQTLQGHAGHIRSVAFSADGKRLVSTSSDRTASVWDIESGKALFSVIPQCQPGAAIFSRDGSLVIFDCGDYGVEDGAGTQVRSSTDGSLVRMLESEGQFTHPLVATRDGSLLAASITDGCMTTQLRTAVWDLKTGKRTDGLWTAADAISPDGRLIAAIDYDDDGGTVERKISLHDGASGKELRTVVAPDRHVDHLTFSSDGSLLLASLGNRSFNSSSTIAVWDTASGKQVAILPGDKQRNVDTLAISPDGKTVVTSYGNSMKVWELPAANLAREIAGNATWGD